MPQVRQPDGGQVLELQRDVLRREQQRRLSVLELRRGPGPPSRSTMLAPARRRKEPSDLRAAT